MIRYQWSIVNEGVIITKRTLQELEAFIEKSNHLKPIVEKMRKCLEEKGVFNYGLGGLYEIKKIVE
jgi:hypothetical protein